MTRLTALFAIAMASLACVSPTPPRPAPIREATQVAASFDATWNAVIDHFVEANVPIATIERASGLIATARLRVGQEEALRFADCGSPTSRTSGFDYSNRPIVFVATSVVYNVLVRGDERAASVRVTASWDRDDPRSRFACETTGLWEAGVEVAVKSAAEG